MEGINRTLFEEIKNYLDYENKESRLIDNVKKFLELKPDDYVDRQKLALEISSQILEPHSKQELPKTATELAKLERNLKELQPHQRDHICHSLLVYLLGLAIIFKFKLCEKYEDFLFQWKLAALLHDVGYPLEITDKLNERFFSEYEKNVLNKEPEFNPKEANYLSRYLPLYSTYKHKNRNALNVIHKRIKEWEIDLEAKNIFDKMSAGKQFDDKPKRTDHGITSSILVLKAIDEKYKKNNPKQENTPNVGGWKFTNLENQVTSACSAMFLHSLADKNLKFDFRKSPLATLLKLCDELQDWARPNLKYPKGKSPEDYNFEFMDNYLTFYVKKQEIKNMTKRLKNILNFPVKIKIL